MIILPTTILIRKQFDGGYMKQLLALFLLSTSAMALDVVGNLEVKTVAFGAVSATYDGGDISSSFSAINKKTHLAWVNTTNGKLSVCIRETTAGDCSKDIPMPASSSGALDQVGYGTAVFLKYLTAPTSGEVILYVW